jgi:hypothetical protein
MMSKYDNAADVSQLPVVIKRKTPSNIPSKALAPVSSKKLITTKMYHPSRQEQISDIEVSYVPANSSRPSQRSKKQQKYQIDFPIYDAEYEELVDDELEPTKKREFKTVPPRDARNLGISKRSNSLEKRKPSEPAAITAISDQKRRTKSELINFNPTKPSLQARKSPNDDWLIDKM